MICPKCHEPMFVAEYDGIELDHCALCAGTWFDHDELGLLFADAAGNVPDALTSETIAALPDADSDEAPRRCPSCRGKLRKVNIGSGDGVLVDVCKHAHGLWFDENEVADLAHGLSGSGDDTSARALAFLRQNCGGSVADKSEGE